MLESAIVILILTYKESIPAHLMFDYSPYKKCFDNPSITKWRKKYYLLATD